MKVRVFSRVAHARRHLDLSQGYPFETVMFPSAVVVFCDDCTMREMRTMVDGAEEERLWWEQEREREFHDYMKSLGY